MSDEITITITASRKTMSELEGVIAQYAEDLADKSYMFERKIDGDKRFNVFRARKYAELSKEFDRISELMLDALGWA